MKQCDNGILLNRISFSENSMIATFFLENSGIQKFVFLGGKKKSGNLFPLGIYEVTYYKRPDSEMGKINQVELVNSMHSIFTNPFKSVIAFFVAEVLHQSIKSEEKDVGLFLFIKNEIAQLENENNLKSYPALFLLKYITHLGIRPHVEDENSSFFNLEQGVYTTNPMNFDKIINSEASSVIKDCLLERENAYLGLELHAKQVVSLLISYLTVHLPNFKGQKSLELAKEILH
jgi:DNA repair protein RecO (recombination protein O)